MTKKQIILFQVLWLFTIGIFGLGFSWLVLSGDCDLKKTEISRLTDSQDDLLLFYSHVEDKPKMRAIINSREDLIKLSVEQFKERCRSKQYKRQLVSILKFYEIYLYMKQAVLQERQDFEWHDSLIPEELVFKK